MEEKILKCPYCGGEMKKGLFHATGANKLLWVPENVNLPAITFNTKKLIDKGAIYPKFKRVSSNAYVTAHCCEECKAIILKGNN